MAITLPTDEVAFDRFVAAFAEELTAVVLRHDLVPSSSLSENVTAIWRLDRDALTRALVAAHAKTIGPQVPLTRLGDRLYAYIGFVQDHGRTPSDRLLLNDVLYRIKTTNEILNPLRIIVSDKELMKCYVGNAVGDRYIVPTLAVLKSPEELDNFVFPPDCYIKPTHASGTMIVRRGGSTIDLRVVRGWFGLNFYLGQREANYRSLIPKVIVEPMLAGHLRDLDYKIFCWRGEPKLVQVGLLQKSQDLRRYFDSRWNEIAPDSAASAAAPLPRPDRLDEMLWLARELSSEFDLVRVDLYVLSDAVLVGEITNCHWAGRDRFRNFAFERKLSEVVFGSP